MPISARVRDLREQRNSLYNQASAILVRAANERRDLTDDECQSVDRFHAECERVDAELQRAGDTPQPTRAGGRQRAADPNPGDAPASTDQALGPEQRCADYVRSRRELTPEQRDMNIGRYLRSMFTPGRRTEAEQRALSEGTDSAGGHTVPDFLASELIDLARAQSVIFQAGARTIPLESDKHTIARVASDPTPAWRAENAAVAESDPSFESVVFEPKSLAVYTKVSLELLQDSNNIEQELPRILSAAMAGELDRVALVGDGNSNEPNGIDTLSNVEEVEHNASITNYNLFLNARRQLLQNSVNAGRINNWILSPDADRDIAGLQDGQNQPLMVPPALDRPRPFTPLVTSKLTDLTGSSETSIFGGDFAQLAVGVRLQLQLQVLRELFAENLQAAFLVYLRADIAAIQPTHLVKITGVTTS